MSTKIELEFDFESKRFESLEEIVIHAFHTSEKPLKHFAAELGYSPCGLSKRLNQAPSDNEPRLSLRDLEKFMEISRDFRPIYYLVEKFLQKDQDQTMIEFQEFKKRLPELKKLVTLLEGK